MKKAWELREFRVNYNQELYPNDKNVVNCEFNEERQVDPNQHTKLQRKSYQNQKLLKAKISKKYSNAHRKHENDHTALNLVNFQECYLKVTSKVSKH